MTTCIVNNTVLATSYAWYCSHHSSTDWCGIVPSGVGQCLSLATVQLCPHGHDIQEAAGARSEGGTYISCTYILPTFHCKQHLLGSIWHKAFCISPVQWPLPCGVPQSHQDGLHTWEGNAHSGRRSRETYPQDMIFKLCWICIASLVASSCIAVVSIEW